MTRMEPPELDGEARVEIARAHERAEELWAAVEELDKEAGGYDFSAEVAAVARQAEDLIAQIESVAVDNEVRI